LFFESEIFYLQNSSTLSSITTANMKKRRLIPKNDEADLLVGVLGVGIGVGVGVPGVDIGVGVRVGVLGVDIGVGVGVGVGALVGVEVSFNTVKYLGVVKFERVSVRPQQYTSEGGPLGP